MELVLFLFLLKPQFSAENLWSVHSYKFEGQILLGPLENTSTVSEVFAIIIDTNLSLAKYFVFHSITFLLC